MEDSEFKWLWIWFLGWPKSKMGDVEWFLGRLILILKYDARKVRKCKPHHNVESYEPPHLVHTYNLGRWYNLSERRNRLIINMSATEAEEGVVERSSRVRTWWVWVQFVSHTLPLSKAFWNLLPSIHLFGMRDNDTCRIAYYQLSGDWHQNALMGTLLPLPCVI